MYTPGRAGVEAELHVSREIALLPFVVYLLGLAFGPLIAAPSSETFGRKIVYLVSLPIFALFTLGAGCSRNIQSLVICRFFAGLFSSTGLSIGTGTVSDVWKPEQRGIAMAIYVAIPQFGPALGPLIGGFVVMNQNWRWTQWTILFFTAIVLALTLGISETYKKQILKIRARKYSLEGPAELQLSAFETIKFFATKTLIRPLHMLLTEVIVGMFALYVGFNFGVLNCFFAAFPYVFEIQYGFDISSIGLTFLGLGIGNIIGLFVVILVDIYRYQPQIQHGKDRGNGTPAPEEHLYIAMIGACSIPISLFWFAWTARSSVHWISPVVAQVFFGLGNLLIFISASLYLTDC